MNKLVKQNEGVWAQYLATKLTHEEERLTKIKGEQHVQYVQSMNRTLQLAAAGDFEAAAQNISTDAAQKFNVLRDTVFTLLDLQGTVAASEFENSQSSYESIFITSVIAISLGVTLASVLGFLLLRSIVVPLDEAIEIAHKVAAGDLTSNIVITSTKSSTGRLLQALKEMNDNLIDLVGKVRMSTDQIATASSEIASVI